VNSYALGILISLLIYVVVGNWAGRKVKHLDDYLVAGRRSPTLLILGTLVASAVGTASFLADSGFAYSGYAVAYIVVVSMNVIGYIFGSLFFGRFIRRARTNTVAEFFGKRFSSRRLRAFAAITVIFGLGGYLMTVTQGAALIISQVTDFSYVGSLIAVWLGYSAFTFYAGSRGVVITDTIMFLFFTIVSFIALAFIVNAGGGWFESVDKLATLEARPGIISASGYLGEGGSWTSAADVWIWAVTIGLAWGVVFAVSPWQSSRYLMAKDEHVVIRSGLFAAIILSLFWPAIMFAGAAIAVSKADIVPMEDAMIWAALNLMPVLAGTVLLAGIVAAALSSASTFLTLVGFAITNDIADSSKRDEARNLKLSRLAVLGVGVVALIVAISVPPNIFWITSFVGPMFAASWGPIAFMSVWSKRMTESGAFWGMIAGFFVCVIPKALDLAGVISLPVYLNPIAIGAVASLVTIVLVSRRGTVTAADKAFLDRLHVVPPELADERRNRLTRLMPALLMGWGVTAAIGLIIIYVRPYQMAVGLVSEGGPYVVWSGELLAAVVFGLVIAFGGVVSRIALKRFLA
jgi:sodium/pantothenate symporter